MKTYPHLIEDICKKEKSTRNVKIIIKTLVGWAQQGVTTNHYKDLNDQLGYKRFSGLGRCLGLVNDVFQSLNQKTGMQIPTLNALCSNMKTNLPSAGLDWVQSGYEALSDDEKRVFVDNLNSQAIKYDQWGYVLKLLGLSPLKDLN